MKIQLSLLLLSLSFPCLSQDTARTVRDGRYSSTSTWKAKKVPANGSFIEVTRKLTFDINAKISGMIARSGATVTIPKGRTVTIESTGNIVFDKGAKFIIDQPSASVKNTIRFTGINENDFIGGGMEVYDTDKGAWNSGEWILKGAYKTAWTNLALNASTGDTVIYVAKASGWRVGDLIAIAPTAGIDSEMFYDQFDERTIKKISGSKITLDSTLKYNHPGVVNPFKKITHHAEVMNLTRNIVIEGTLEGRAHVNFLHAGKQMISFVEFNYMGPRRGPPGKSVDVLGRYGLHFHHCGDSSRGSVIDGAVVKRCGSHAFVPHASHGITLNNNISYDTFEDAYWWDFPPDKSTIDPNSSNDTDIDSCLAERVKCDPPNRGYRTAGFTIGAGTGNKITNSGAAGIWGTKGAAGFIWDEPANYFSNTWDFNGNWSHNNRNNALFSWQNDSTSHLIQNFPGFNCGANGIEHGAYHNAYKYKDIDLFANGNGILLHATAIKNGQKDSFGYTSSFTNVNSTEPLYITVHTLPGTGTLFYNCSFPKVVVNELPARVANPPAGLFDFIDCRLQPDQFDIIGMEKESIIRVQDGGKAYQIDSTGVKQIPIF